MGSTGRSELVFPKRGPVSLYEVPVPMASSGEEMTTLLSGEEMTTLLL